MGDAVDWSNAKNSSAGDTKGGFHEEGGVYGLDSNGKQITVAAQPGDAADPSVVDHAAIDVWSDDAAKVTEVQGTYHVHPSGEVVQSPPPGTIGDETKTSSFNQSPSNPDIGNATDSFNNPGSAYHTTGSSYVLGAGNGTVSIYNQCGTIATFPLKQFRAIGNKYKP